MPGKVERDVHAQKLIMIAREVAGCGGKGIVQLSDARMILLVQVSAMKRFPPGVKVCESSWDSYRAR